MTYKRSDPMDPPMCMVLVDGDWWHGMVLAREQRQGVWWASVEYQRDGNRRGWFPSERVRGDGTDWARGRVG